MTQIYINVWKHKGGELYRTEAYSQETFEEAKQNIEDYFWSWDSSGYEYSHTLYEDTTVDGSLKKLIIE